MVLSGLDCGVISPAPGSTGPGTGFITGAIGMELSRARGVGEGVRGGESLNLLFLCMALGDGNDFAPLIRPDEFEPDTREAANAADAEGGYDPLPLGFPNLELLTPADEDEADCLTCEQLPPAVRGVDRGCREGGTTVSSSPPPMVPTVPRRDERKGATTGSSSPPPTVLRRDELGVGVRLPPLRRTLLARAAPAGPVAAGAGEVPGDGDRGFDAALPPRRSGA